MADSPGEKAHKIKYDTTLLKLMSFFETTTKARLRDCFVDQNDLLVFVVEPAQFGLAVGKGGANVKRLETTLKKKVKIAEYSDDVLLFTAGLISPSKARDITMADGVVTITPEPESRSYLIGRAGKNVHNFQATIQRYFPIKELKIL